MEVGEICNMHHRLWGLDALEISHYFTKYRPTTVVLTVVLTAFRYSI